MTSAAPRSIRPRGTASRRRWGSTRRSLWPPIPRCSTRPSSDRVTSAADRTGPPSFASPTQRFFRGPRGSPAVFVTHELLHRGAVEERAYQVNIARACLERSTLVVLPTGMGKTVIAAMVIAEVLRRRGGRILFHAPTKPLVEQHAASMRNVLVVDRVTLFTGEATAPEDRELLWRENKIIVSTPPVIRNELPVEAPDVSKEIRKLLQTVVDEQVARLKKLGFLADRAKVTRKDLLAVGNEARQRLDSGVKDGRLYGAMTAQAIAMKADHAIELT